MQGVFQPQQPRAFLFGQLGHRYAGPHGNDVGDISGQNLAAHMGALFGPIVFPGFQLFLGLLFLVAHPGGAFKVLLVDGCRFFLLHFLDLLLQILQVIRSGEGAQADAGAGFVDQVDRLVGQETIRDVAGGQLDGGPHRLFGDLDLMVRFIAVAQPLQDFKRLFLAGLPDHDRLETTFECRVLFNVFPVFVRGGGADDLEVAARERGLQDIRGVGGALRGAGADDRVQLVDEEDDIAGIADLIHGRLDALLKITAVFGPRDHSGQIQRDQALALQKLRHLALGDFQRQPLHNGGFADAGLADQARVVLRSAREDLDHAIDLLLAADDGVDAALRRQRGQIAAELIQGLRAALPLSAAGDVRGAGLAPHFFAAAQRRVDFGHDVALLRAERVQKADAVAVAFGEHRHQKVLGADVIMSQAGGLHDRDLKDPLAARGEVIRRQAGLRAAPDLLDHQVFHLLRRDLELSEHGRGDAAALLQKAEDDMLAADIGMSHIFRGFDGKVQSVVCFFRKSVKPIHAVSSFYDARRSDTIFARSASRSAGVIFLASMMVAG